MRRASLVLMVVISLVGLMAAQRGGTTAGGASAVTGSGTTSAMTPILHLETAMPSAGATSTPGGVPAGISSSDVGGGQNSGSTTTVPVLQNGSPQRDPMRGAAADESATVEDVYGSSYGGTNLSAAASASGAGGDSRSLAEVAASYRRDRAVQHARTMTNEDVARLNARDRGGVMDSGMPGDSMPQGDDSASAGAVEQPGAPAPQSDVVVAQNQAPATDRPAAEATTPQAPGPNRDDANNQREADAAQLPATASPLPFLAALAFLAGGVGMVYRMRRQPR